MTGVGELAAFWQQMPVFLLVVFRVGGLMIMAPFFGSLAIPGKVKIALVVSLSAALWPVLPHKPVVPATLPAIAVGVGGELVIGLAIGLAVTVIFAGLQLAGQAVGQQMGIALADVFNPAFDESVDVLGVLYYWVGLVVFLAIGGHRLLIGSLVDSFRLVPVGGLVVGRELVGVLTGMLAASFLMAFKIAIPAVLALFLTSVAMGLISRTVPQLNILTAGFAIRSSLGMLMAAATVLAAMSVFGGTVEQAMVRLNRSVSIWAGPVAGP